MLQTIKCTSCGKVLLEATGEVRKICPKCKTMVHVVTTSIGIFGMSEVEKLIPSQIAYNKK